MCIKIGNSIFSKNYFRHASLEGDAVRIKLADMEDAIWVTFATQQKANEHFDKLLHDLRQVKKMAGD